MALSTSQVLLYAASTGDLQKARGVAAVLGLPSNNVQNDFNTVWGHVASGNYLVIAVGGAALDSLYYNPCGWTNPNGQAAGSTPFAIKSGPVDTLPGANYFINAAGSTAADTLYLAAAYAYYAINGSYPAEFSSPPTPESPSSTCGSTFNSDVSCPCSSSSGGSSGSFSCSTSACGTSYSAQQFYNMYGPYAEWASSALQLPLALILTEWYEESGNGSANICTPYNNPANIYGSGPQHPYDNICDGVYDGYIEAFSSTSIFPVSASDGNGRTAAQYIQDAFNNGYTVPSSNGYGSVPGAGTQFGPGLEAACAAMGAMGWAQSNYYTSGDSPNAAGNILWNWYNTYFSGIVSETTISSASEPSCCGSAG